MKTKLKSMKTKLQSIITAVLTLALTLTTGAALAAIPVAVWNGDLFDNSTKNNITLTLNGNSVANGVVTIDQTKGVQFYNHNFNSRAITVIFKYSELDTASTTSRSLVTVGGGNNSTATGSSDDYLGLYALNGSTAKGIVSGAAWNNDAAGNSKGSFSSAGVIALAYNYDNGGTRGYMDGSLVYAASGLKGQNMYTRFIGVGGNYVTTGNGKLAAATGMKIEAVAIFNTALSETEIAGFSFPYELSPEQQAFYAKWSDQHAIMTVDPRGQGYYHTCYFGPFDPVTGFDTGKWYNGNANPDEVLPGQTANNFLAWKIFCSGQNYVAPGYVARFASVGRQLSAGFGPLNFAGIIVEEGATGWSIKDDSGNGRGTIIGDIGGDETWMVFKEDFTIARRTGDTTDTADVRAQKFVGPVNLDIADGKVFDFNSVKTAAYLYLDPDRSTSVKFHGGGTLKVATLTAAGAVTLDYSAQTLNRLAEGTPFITGTLAVDASTTIVLPAKAQPSVAYKLATTISGDTIAALKLGESELPQGATMVINQTAGTIGFVEAAFEQDVEGKKSLSSITWPSGDPSTSDLVTFNLATNAELTLDEPFQYMTLALNCAWDASVIVDSEAMTPMTIKGVEGAKLTLVKTENAIITQTILVDGFSEIEVQGEFEAGEIAVGSQPIIALSEGASIIVNSGAIDATFKGEGQVVFDGVAPSAAAKGIFQDSTLWTGTVWLKNLNLIDNNFKMTNYGNEESKIKLTGITGFAPQASNPETIDCPIEVELVDEDETLAVELNNGYSNLNGQPTAICTYTFAKITGSGTFKNSGGGCSPQYRFVNVADFTGTLWVASNMRFVIGNATGFGDSQKITIDGNAEIACTLTGKVVNKAAVTLKGGKSLTFAAGDEGTVEVVDGTLRLTLTTNQAVAGYTASGVTLPQGQNVVFVKPDGTEIDGDGNAFGGDGVVWTGAATDGLWATAENWSNHETPTADTEVSIKQDAEIILAEGDVCSNLVLNANVTLKGNVSTLGTTSVGEGYALTFNVAKDAEMIVSNAINGAGQVVKSGEGKLILTQASGFTGGLIVNDGLVKSFSTEENTNATHKSCLGVRTVTINGGTVDLNGTYPDNVNFTIKGVGFDGNGALINTGASLTSSPTMGSITLAGDATIGGTGTFYTSGGTLTFGEGYVLTKKGAFEFPLRGNAFVGTGKIVIEEGLFNNNWGNNGGETVDLEIKSDATNRLNGASLMVHDFKCSGTIDGNAATLKIYGTLFGGVSIPKLEFADGATADLTAGIIANSSVITFGPSLTLVLNETPTAASPVKIVDGEFEEKFFFDTIVTVKVGDATLPGKYMIAQNAEGMFVTESKVRSWTGNVGDGDWSNAANWDGGVPGEDDLAIIEVDGSLSLTLPASGVGPLAELRLLGSGNLALDATKLTAVKTIPVDRDITIEATCGEDASLAIVGTGALVKNGQGALTLAACGFATATVNEGALDFFVDESETLTVATVISGAGAVEKTGAGTLVLAPENTYAGGTIVLQGTVELGNYKALGANGSQVQVCRGAILNTKGMNGVDAAYTVKFVDEGEGVPGCLTATANTGVGKTYPARYLWLDGADAVLNAPEGANYGLVGNGYGATTIALSTNTVTKTGTGTFIFCNTTIQGEGTIAVAEGTLACLHSGSVASDATLKLDGGSLNLGAALTVKDFEVVLPAGATTPYALPANLTVTGTLRLDAADAELVASLAQDGVQLVTLTAAQTGLKVETMGALNEAMAKKNLKLVATVNDDGSVTYTTAKSAGFLMLLR